MAIRFSIKLPIEPFKIIKENSTIFMIGSCFAEHIGNKLNNVGYKTIVNPFGILFNPISISNSIASIITNKQFATTDLIQIQDGRYVSLSHHGSCSGLIAETVKDDINSSIIKAHHDLKYSDTLIITLGSAWVYTYLKTETIVANCHKIPNKEFSKRLLDVAEIVDSLNKAILLIKGLNPKLNIIFSISPVKHLRDGVVENQQSKAALILAIAELIKQREANLFYFPAYEIVTDELRDYRFFENDHAHPNQLAIEYVWERFLTSCFDAKAIEKVNEAEQISKALNHKPLHFDQKNENLQERINLYLDKYSKQ